MGALYRKLAVAADVIDTQRDVGQTAVARLPRNPNGNAGNRCAKVR
jgi:hypothetical protein